jgi:hypothetical protein
MWVSADQEIRKSQTNKLIYLVSAYSRSAGSGQAVFIRGKFEKTKPILKGRHECKYLYKRSFWKFQCFRAAKKQSQFVSVRCSAFSGQRQDQEKEFEKTKPIFKRAKQI